MSTNPSPANQTVVVRMSVVMTADGNVNLQCEAVDPLAAVHALGQATCLLAAKAKEAQKPRIEIAHAFPPLLAQ